MESIFFGSDIVEMVLNAGAMAKFVLLVLLGFSVVTWALIFMKLRIFSKIGAETEEFLDIFWQEKNLKELYNTAREMQYSPVAFIFMEGYEELRNLRKMYGDKLDHKMALEEVERVLKRTITEQISELEYGMGFLATTGNTTPFIGLFGTVWGIMTAFRGIGLKGSASLAVVAPGISEALITTAAGLAAAIPAVIAFNFFSNKLSHIRADMEGFVADFLNVLERYLERSRKEKKEEEEDE